MVVDGWKTKKSRFGTQIQKQLTFVERAKGMVEKMATLKKNNILAPLGRSRFIDYIRTYVYNIYIHIMINGLLVKVGDFTTKHISPSDSLTQLRFSYRNSCGFRHLIQ